VVSIQTAVASSGSLPGFHPEAAMRTGKTLLAQLMDSEVVPFDRTSFADSQVDSGRIADGAELSTRRASLARRDGRNAVVGKSGRTRD
jgi:hypothetical protein